MSKLKRDPFLFVSILDFSQPESQIHHVENMWDMAAFRFLVFSLRESLPLTSTMHETVVRPFRRCLSVILLKESKRTNSRVKNTLSFTLPVETILILRYIY